MQVHNKMDFTSGLFLLAFGLFLAGLSLRLAIWSRSGPEAGFFPLVIGLLIIGCSLGVLGGSLALGGGAKDRKVSEKHEGRAAGFVGPAFYTAVMLACGFLLESLGFLIASSLLLFVILKYLERQSWRMTILLGFSSIIISYVLFKYLLGVPLPGGLLLSW